MIFNLNRFQVSFGFNFCWIEWFSKFILFMHMHMQNDDKYWSYSFLTKRKAFGELVLAV
jgi:heme/copper-type cytochrome/quinol oxidase subunit 4